MVCVQQDKVKGFPAPAATWDEKGNELGEIPFF